MDTEERRLALAELLRSAVAAVSPEPLAAGAVTPVGPHQTLIAIGKAAAAMSRGAARVLGKVSGVCVTNAEDRVPEGVELLVGDHPIPGDRSFHAGQRVLEVAGSADGQIVALISGGGSALCERPIEGIEREYVVAANQQLIASGASIETTNLVRRHLSETKNGGVARHAAGSLVTYLISDVSGGDLALVASGPTIQRSVDPDQVIAVMTDHGIPTPEPVRSALRNHRVPDPPREGEIVVLADGHTATRGLVRSATARGIEAREMEGWIDGDVEEALSRFLDNAPPGLTVAAGEPDVAVAGEGKGGRNTHAALLAAERLAGSDAVFAAFATDGVDGSSGSAGAIVDGQTVQRGGDPRAALEAADSASYLFGTGDLLVTGPTGTNVADLWVLWR